VALLDNKRTISILTSLLITIGLATTPVEASQHIPPVVSHDSVQDIRIAHKPIDLSPDQNEIHDTILKTANKHGLNEETTLKALRIAWCESNYTGNAQNPYSSAGGVFQFIDGTWNYYASQFWETTQRDKMNPKDNIELAVLVLKHQGDTDWRADPASESCWDTA